MTESELIEGMARTACETELLGDWHPEGQMFWLAEARGVLAYLRAHAEEVCHLLGGAGPKAVGFAREWLANAPDEGWPGQDDLRDALREG